MAFRNTSEQYGSVSKFFHWVIFFLVVCMFFIGYFMDDLSGEIKGTVVNIHKVTGILILLLMLLRLIWSLTNIKPLVPNAKPWEKMLERSGHFLLYFVLFAMPVSGWLMTIASGKPPRLFNIALTFPFDKNKPLAELCESIHSSLAIIIIVLVSLHVLAAVYHHIIKKDNVLRRMLP